jgi:hypothetical protein
MSEEVPKNATKCVGNRSVNAEFWWGTYRGTAAKKLLYLIYFQRHRIPGGSTLLEDLNAGNYAAAADQFE